MSSLHVRRPDSEPVVRVIRRHQGDRWRRLPFERMRRVLGSEQRCNADSEPPARSVEACFVLAPVHCGFSLWNDYGVSALQY